MTIHTLPTLPFDREDLAPFISAETIDFHYGKHHKAYVDNLNKLLENTPFAEKSLIEIIKTATTGTLFNNASQTYNHTFFWESLTPPAKSIINEETKTLLEKNFTSVEEFKKQFTESAMKVFGSGWTWLVKQSDGSLKIINTLNAKSPISLGNDIPLLVVDIWEHSYYIDYRNARAKYLENIWNIINWDFISKNYK